MGEMETISFPRPLTETVALRQIEWWHPASRFVVVKYVERGILQEFGKRLDLDKGAFLDGFDDDILDTRLKALLPEIREAVATRRREEANLTSAFA